jgi:hypothetical protein
MTGGIFRTRRYAPEHPGIERVLASTGATEASSPTRPEDGDERR